MKRLNSKIINKLTGRDLKTVLHPRTVITDEITLSTNRDFHHHAYILDIKKLEFTEDNAIISKLPKKSNIKDITKELDSIKKKINGDKLSSIGDDYTKTSWIDGFNRHFATKIETPDHVNYVLRGDIANDLFLQNKVLVQCSTSVCDALLPSKITVDLKKFVAKDPTARE